MEPPIERLDRFNTGGDKPHPHEARAGVERASGPSFPPLSPGQLRGAAAVGQ